MVFNFALDTIEFSNTRITKSKKKINTQLCSRELDFEK